MRRAQLRDGNAEDVIQVIRAMQVRIDGHDPVEGARQQPRHYFLAIWRDFRIPLRSGRRLSDGLPRLTMLGRGSSASLREISQSEGIALLPPGIDRIEPGTRLAFELI